MTFGAEKAVKAAFGLERLLNDPPAVVTQMETSIHWANKER